MDSWEYVDGVCIMIQILVSSFMILNHFQVQIWLFTFHSKDNSNNKNTAQKC